MKVLRAIGLFISKLGLSVAVICLILSFSLDSFVKEGVTSVLVSNSASEEIFNEIGIQSEQVQEIIETEEAQELINKYVNPLLEGDVDVSNIDIGSDLLEFVRNNEEKIEAIVGVEISMDEIEAYVQSEEMGTITEAYKAAVEQVQEEIPVEVKKASSSVFYFFSDEFRGIMFIVGIVGLILTALLQWSLYLWIKTLGNIFTWSGLLIVICSGFGSIFVTGILERMDFGMKIDFTKVLINSLGVLGVGIILLIIYMIIGKFISKRNVRKEEVVEG